MKVSDKPLQEVERKSKVKKKKALATIIMAIIFVLMFTFFILRVLIDFGKVPGSYETFLDSSLFFLTIALTLVCALFTEQ